MCVHANTRAKKKDCLATFVVSQVENPTSILHLLCDAVRTSLKEVLSKYNAVGQQCVMEIGVFGGSAREERNERSDFGPDPILFHDEIGRESREVRDVSVSCSHQTR